MENHITPDSQLPAKFQEASNTAAPLQWQIAHMIQQAINDVITEQAIEPLGSTKLMISHIRKLLRQHALKVVCPGCGRAADIYFSSTQGSIRFRHTTADGRHSNHGGKTHLDPLEVVPVADSRYA